MDSSPDVERFGISDADFDYMYDPLRRKKSTSKNQKIYGIFASSSDSDVEDSGMGTKASIRNRKNATFSGPITFVSGGIKEGSRNQVTESLEGEVDIEISDEEDDKQLFSRKHFSKATASESSTPCTGTHHLRRPSSSSTNRGFGSWERHTKGIGTKLLQKMGFRAGEGLGKEGQGIVTPVEALKRAGKGAVGSMGTEVAPAPRKGNEPLPLHAEDKNRISGFPRYKKKGVMSSHKSIIQKPIYLSTDELIARVSPATPAAAVNAYSALRKNTEPSSVKVIDMTSREQRVYGGYEAALGNSMRRSLHDDSMGGVDVEVQIKERRVEGRFFELPILCHNVDLVVNTAETQIRRFDRDARYEEDRVAGLVHEIGRLTEVIEKTKFEVDELSTALDLIVQFELALKKNVAEINLTPEICTNWINRIRLSCEGLPELPALMAAVARPLLDSLLGSWQPLMSPGYGIAVLAQLRSALDDPAAFEILLRSSWLPKIRRQILNDWDPHDCDTLLSGLEAWKFILPDHIVQQYILQGLVLPRLNSAVEEWNPLTDTVPIHTWLHPWLPWFGSGISSSTSSPLASVHEVVLSKLAICLKNWHPSDSSARSVLAPWRNVLPMAQVASFLNRNITPKLALVIQSLQINPADQNMEPWNWVMRWLDIIDPAVIADMLERFFLARWLECLSGWLVQALEARNRRLPTAGQIFSEIGAWYSGWKSQIPPDLIDYPSVKDALTKALSFMERAMLGIPPPTGGTYPAKISGRPIVMQPPPPRTEATELITNLREQIEQKAAQRGFLFMPLANRFYEGKQIFRLENKQIYFERNVAFCYSAIDSGWHPVSVGELLSMTL